MKEADRIRAKTYEAQRANLAAEAMGALIVIMPPGRAIEDAETIAVNAVGFADLVLRQLYPDL